MGKIQKIIDYIFHNPRALILAVLVRTGFLIPDRLYLKWLFRLKMGYKLDLDNPQTFNEKLQWLKLYNRKPEYTMMVDKYEVKKYVANIIGEEHVIPTIGVWDRFEDIDWNILPNQFVLKTTHGGGNSGVIICNDKEDFDIESAKKKLNSSFKIDIYRLLREWPYKNVTKRIIAEVLMKEDNGLNNPNGDLIDYKFYCFNGQAKVMLVVTDRHAETGVCFDYFDKNFNHYPFEQGGPNSKKQIERPKHLQEMWDIAEKLSVGLPHVRVDLYCVNGHVYFGELTFFDSSGIAEFSPQKWDYIFGNWIELPIKEE